MDRSIAFWDRIAEKYAASPISDEESYQIKLDRVAAALPPNARVLEIGAGTGTTAIRLAPFAAEIIATEPAPGLLAIARERAVEAGVTNIQFIEAAADDMREGGSLRALGPFDAVIAFNVIHVLGRPRSAIEDAAALLKPGGIFATSTFFMSGAFHLLRPILWAGKAIGRLPTVSLVSERSMKKWHRSAGFTLEPIWKPKGFNASFTLARKG